MPTPTLSAVRHWDTAHLTEAAGTWTTTATVWEDTFTELVTRIGRPGGSPWSGEAADAAQERAHCDRMTVIVLADQLHSASTIARTGATQINQARQAVLQVVDAAHLAGFIVAEDFSVSDPRYYTAATAAARQAQAEIFAAQLRSAVRTLVAADHGVATALTTATAGLSTATFPESGGPAPDIAGQDRHATLKRIESANNALLDELEAEYRQLPEGQIKTDRLADIAGIRKSLATPDSHLVHIDRPDDPSQMIPAAVAVGDPYAADHVSVTVPGVGSATRKSLPTMTQEAGELVTEAQLIASATQSADSVAAIAFMGYQPPLTMTSPEILDDDLAQAGAPQLRAFLSDLDAAAKPGHTTALFGHSYGSLMSGIALKGGAGATVDNVVLYGSPGFEAGAASDLGLRDDQLFVMSAPGDQITYGIGALAPLHGWGADPNAVVGDHYLFTHLETEPGTVRVNIPGGAVEWDKTGAHGHSEYARAATERMAGFNLAAILLDRPDLTVTTQPTDPYNLMGR